ncbi:MAG: hypothetical protein KDC04_05855 [Saprospiraceae bacterium]|nr:hypothetical protein [Saprospiraceae bacterium]MCB9309835.1 tetratricopeptide repeat protein [Lewinellaceae bacterium]
MNSDRIQQLIKLRETDPIDSFVSYALALEYFKVGDFHLSEQIFSDLMVKDPEYVGIYFHFGRLYEAMDDKEKAKKVYQQGILICKKLNDIHSLSELTSALQNLEIDE